MMHHANIHCLIVSPRRADNARTRALVADAHALGIHALAQIEQHALYFVQGALSENDLQRLAAELLTDPVAELARWRTRDAQHGAQLIQVALRPGVTDPVAHEIVRAAHALGITNVEQAATGQQYVVRGKHNQPLSDHELHTLARRLLANDVIQHYALGEIEPTFPQADASAHASGIVETIPITELSDGELLQLSAERRAALDLNEMRAVQNYFRSAKQSVGREPTDVEFEMLAQTWSEHCVHKTFKAKISHQSSVNSHQSSVSSLQSPVSGGVVDGILKTFLRAATEKINAPWVRSAFVDNAGIIDFDDEFEISFKVETHNHPSAIEPFGGANTGVGGVIRDVLGVSAKPIAATDVLCFGPQDVDAEKLPEGVLHPRVIRSGVVAGVQDYGNKIGIPTVSGAIYYDEGYTANPLVFCGCVGIAPKNKHPRTPQANDHIIVLGGRTGRDGLRGATFSSMTMDAQTGEVAGASVQIGDPITEKGLIEVITRARDANLYHAITDCGAGGLSSAVGEMARETGAAVELKKVRLKYPGLAPWEIWLSEAQERMVLAVPLENITALQNLCETYEVELTDIGAFNDSGHVIVNYDGRAVLDLRNDFLHDGIPQRELKAVISNQLSVISNQLSVISNQLSVISNQLSVKQREARNENFNQRLLELLAHPNIASKADVIRIYDHEVQGGTVVKPLTGVMNDAPSDAVVLKPIGTRGTRGIVLSCGLNPEYGKHDAYRMALSVIDEAMRNAVAVGADPTRIALLDNFCWGDPKRPETLGALVEAARGCHDGARLFGAPFISGKDSLNNEYLGADGQRHAIPPTLLISAIGIIDDVNQAVTMDLKQGGNMIYRVGVWQRDDSFAPPLSQETPRVYRALHQAIRAGRVRACHDLSEGGLAVAAAEMCIGGRLGMAIEIATTEMLFGETNGCLLAEVAPNDCEAFEHHLEEIAHACQRLGVVTTNPRLEIRCDANRFISLAVEHLVTAWNSNLQSFDHAQDKSPVSDLL
ncbi:MAG: phosphoribosylformylglycinamidine synthase subunit PurL [Chloroflexi bacterium]|nr:phosphoribosylformylglycinamidine synthase subunit PurL [Chloroflexota bacterium]